MRSATSALMAGQTTGVEEKLQAAEAAETAALQGAEPDDKTRDLIGQIAAIRATLALTPVPAGSTIIQARRALEYLHPDNLPFRSSAIWTLGFAYQLQGDRAAARQAYTEAIASARRPGISTPLYWLQPAWAKYRNQKTSFIRRPRPTGAPCNCSVISHRRMPAKRILAWPASSTNGTIWMPLSSTGSRASNWRGSMISVIDRFIICEVFLARLKLARGDVAGAAAMLAETEQSVRQHNFVHRIPEVAAAQVLVLLRQGDLAAAAHLAQNTRSPHQPGPGTLAQGDPSAALAVLEPLRQQMEAKGWQDERLKVMVLQAVALPCAWRKGQGCATAG